VSRLEYPTNVRPIRVMCSATVSPHYILRAFQSGADAVMVGG
jgi:F420-non-reducing hydrogenase iron-sulfur subunit